MAVDLRSDRWGGQTEPGGLRPVHRLMLRLAVVSWAAYLLSTAVVVIWPRLWLDRAVLSWIDGRLLTRGPVSYVLAHLGAAPVVAPLVVLASAYFVFRRRALVPALLLSLSYALVCFGVYASKELVRRGEPAKPLGASGYAYPSGHEASGFVGWVGFAVAWVVLDRLRGSPCPRRALFAVAAAVVALIWVVMLLRSAHWLTDMVGGLALGAASLGTVGAVVLWTPVVALVDRATPSLFKPIR